MVSDVFKILASRHGGVSGNTSTIFDLTASSTSTLVLTIPNGYVYYLLSYGGNVQTPGVTIQMLDRASMEIEGFQNFPDSFVRFELVPFIQENFRDRVQAYFNNTSASTNTITFFIEGVLIPERNYLAFEDELYQYASLGVSGRKCI